MQSLIKTENENKREQIFRFFVYRNHAVLKRSAFRASAVDQGADEEISSGEVTSEALMNKFEKQEKRIIAILGTEEVDVTRKTLSTYLKYMKNHVEIPCQLTGIEDFEWEEPYVFGFRSKKEYEELKKTQPSYKDKFNLIKFVDEIDDYYDGIFIHVQRISDKKEFVLPLADLKSTDRKSKNYQLLDDYSVWFVNNR